jgi:pyruvate/2-oxoglutarate dehydrogenase complex dihydrolipoamide acyltransferase (E2) component
VETDKALSPVHATFSGRLVKILVHEGDVVKVLTPIAEAEEA